MFRVCRNEYRLNNNYVDIKSSEFLKLPVKLHPSIKLIQYPRVLSFQREGYILNRLASKLTSIFANLSFAAESSTQFVNPQRSIGLSAMAKEKSDKGGKDKKEKHEKKEKRSEKDGVHKSKNDKKEKKPAENDDVVTKLLNTLEEEKPGAVAMKENGDVEVKVKAAALVGALVPFANPLADEKVAKKVLKSVKKGMIYSGDRCYTETADLNLISCEEQVSQARRQRSSQVPPQSHDSNIWLRITWRCDPRGRYLTNGRHITYSSAVRRSWSTVSLRHVKSRAGRSGEHEAADECGYDYTGEGGEEEGGRGTRRGRGGVQGGL